MSGKSDRYLIRVSIFLITAALIAGMAGCAPAQYDLTISSTAGGSTIPIKGTHTYNAGTVVNLVATPDANHRFAEWTGDVDYIADVEDATTTITIHSDYAITANFYKPEIRDWYDLDAIRNNLGGDFILMNDLNSTTPGYEELASLTAIQGKGWQPTGHIDPHPPFESHLFTGTFDGQGYEICDLFINRPDAIFVGLFGIAAGAHIENISLVNVTATGDCEVGGLVGHIEDAIVNNCFVTGNVTGAGSKAGGLVGCILNTSVNDSYSTATVNGHSEVGGLVGDSYYGTVINSYSTSSVNGDYYVGGLLGHLTFGTVSNSYSAGNVTGINYVGGLAGSNSVDSIVRDSYSTSSVSGNTSVGGLVGANVWDGTVTNSYSTGTVTGNSSVGGLVGWNEESTVNNSFWDVQTSGQATSAGRTGKNTTEMKDVITFSEAGWNIIAVALNETNFSYIWNIVDDVTYPFLSWQAI